MKKTLLFLAFALLVAVIAAAPPVGALVSSYATYDCSYDGPGGPVNTTVSAKSDQVAALECKNFCTSAWAQAPERTPTDGCTDTPQFGTICSGSSSMADCDTARVVQQ